MGVRARDIFLQSTDRWKSQLLSISFQFPIFQLGAYLPSSMLFIYLILFVFRSRTSHYLFQSTLKAVYPFFPRMFKLSRRDRGSRCPTSTMKIVKLNLKHVLDNVDSFNSCSHPPDSLLTTLPSLGVQEPPDVSLTDWGFWCPLILFSQNVGRHSVRVINLIPSYAELLVEASKSAIITRQVPETHKRDLLDSSAFKRLFEDPSKSYFLRFANASAKDGVRAHRALKTSADVIERIVTSQRAIRAIEECVRETLPVRLYFVPFDRTFDTRKEYRCFSAPISPICNEPKLTAISQYRWESRWTGSRWYAIRSTNAYLAHLHDRAQTFQQNILSWAKTMDPETAEGLREHGFVFDVRCIKGGEVQLIDLKSFGVTSKTGSALFHWIEDAVLLYGGKEEVEIRVAY
jgi:hypothetical protein